MLYDMTRYDTIRYDIRYDMIFVNCSWVATRWQQHSTHLHTNSTQNDTEIWEECRPCPIFASYTLAFGLQLRKIMEGLQSG